jgi:hypothetical protein
MPESSGTRLYTHAMTSHDTLLGQPGFRRAKATIAVSSLGLVSQRVRRLEMSADEMLEAEN